jgi:hypothetical protein
MAKESWLDGHATDKAGGGGKAPGSTDEGSMKVEAD